MSQLPEHSSAGEPRRWQENLSVAGDELVERIKELVRAGNVRRIIVKHDERTILELPLTLGIVGALLAPQLAALAAIAGLLTKASVTVEREELSPPSAGDASQLGPGPGAET
jgi:hypothetical protein